MHHIRAWRQRPLAYWAVAAVLVLATAVAVVDLLGAARRAKAAYGQTVEVPVARRALAAGTVIGPADVDRRALPRAVVPPGAGPVEAVVGRTVRWPVLTGEVVVDARLAGGEASTGPAALLPPGTVGLAVPTGRAMPPLAVGTRVAVVAAGDEATIAAGPVAAGGGSGADAAGRTVQGRTAQGSTVADGTVVDGPGGVVVAGTVVALDAGVATIAVPATLAPRLVAALARGDLAVALRGP